MIKTHENVNISKTMTMRDKKDVVLYYKAAIDSGLKLESGLN